MASPRRRLERIRFTGPAGRLAGLLHRPAAAPRFAAVVSHPHPLHGGTMDNKVAYRVARALEDAGGFVLRFNFRGAGRGKGRSDGVHDDGRGERDDLSAALAELRRRGGQGLPTLLAGFSFGAVMSTAVALADPSIDALLLVGVPTGAHDLGALRGLHRPVALVQGDRDEHGPLDGVRALFGSLEQPKELRVVSGADHFFEGRQRELAEQVRALATGPLAASLTLEGA